MSPKWTLIVLLLSWSASQINCENTRVSFGKDCGPSIRCNSKKALSCNANKKCGCIKPEEMVYDKVKGKCVAMAGERCSYTTVTNSTPHGERWTEELDCVQKSRCHQDGYCRCEGHYFETAGGSCSRKHIQGGNCSNHNQCRTDLSFFCQNGVCSCNPTEAAFDPELKKCVGMAGAECSKYEDLCVHNARCPPEKHHQYFDYLGGKYYREKSAPSSHRRCECLPGYQKSKDGHCLGKYDMACGDDGGDGDGELPSCNDDYVCINGKCSCPFPQHQLHIDGIGPCVSLVGGPCNEQVNGSSEHYQQFGCVDHAHCNESTCGVLECHCDEGYIESPTKKCEVAHGGSCSPQGTPCDSAADLICRNGRCSCQDFEVYDEVERKCRGLSGAQCTTQDSIMGYCVNGAFCQPPRLSRFRPVGLDWLGTCRCNSTLTTKPDRTCIATSDEPMVMATNGPMAVVTKGPKRKGGKSGKSKSKRPRKGKPMEEESTTDPNLAGVSSLSTTSYDSEEF